MNNVYCLHLLYIWYTYAVNILILVIRIHIYTIGAGTQQFESGVYTADITNPNAPAGNTYTYIIMKWDPTNGLNSFTYPVPDVQLKLNGATGATCHPQGQMVSSLDNDGYTYVIVRSKDSLSASIIGYDFNFRVPPPSTTWITGSYSYDAGNGIKAGNTVTVQYIELDLYASVPFVSLEGVNHFPGAAAGHLCYLGQYYLTTAQISVPFGTSIGVSDSYPYYPNVTSLLVVSQNLVFIYLADVQQLFCDPAAGVSPPSGANILVSIANYTVSVSADIKYRIYLSPEFETMTHKPGTNLLFFTNNDGSLVTKYNYVTGVLTTQPYATIMGYSPQYTYGLCNNKAQSTFLDISYTTDFSYTCSTPNGYYYQSPGKWYFSDPTCIDLSPDELLNNGCPSLTALYNTLVTSTCTASYSTLCSTSALENPPYSCTQVVPANILQTISNAFANSQLVFGILSILVILALKWYYRKTPIYITHYRLPPASPMGSDISAPYSKDDTVFNVRGINPSFSK